MIRFENKLTAEEFIDSFHELPDGGRWTELCEGEIHTLEPPDEVHGNVVYHLSQAIAQSINHQKETTGTISGYACFEQGLIVSRNPDTVQFPSISFFHSEHLFEMTDQIVTEITPEMVVEIASTPLRRKNLDERIENYRALGIKMIWIIDPAHNQLAIHKPGDSNVVYAGDDQVEIPEFLPELSITVSELFRNPEWYK